MKEDNTLPSSLDGAEWYAQQLSPGTSDAVEFADWKDNDCYRENLLDTWVHIPSGKQCSTNKELYNLFLQSKQKDKK
jgi:hypothetical protein